MVQAAKELLEATAEDAAPVPPVQST